MPFKYNLCRCATDEVFLIKSGKVDIIVKDKETGENVKVATRETGEFGGVYKFNSVYP